MILSPIARMSSIPDAAITNDGTPFLTPSPFCCSRIREGITTAGDTAEIMNLSDNKKNVGVEVLIGTYESGCILLMKLF